MRAKAEFTDQFTQRYHIAFGGPIADSGFSYRLTAGSYTGDGQIENLGAGPDAGEPDQRTFAPQLRFKNDRWDVTARYSKQTDKGTQHASIPLGGWDTTREFLEDAAGNPICPVDVNTGEEVCQTNPFFGIGQSPSVANCDNINPDGTFRTTGGDVTTAQLICDPEDLQLKVSLNASLNMDNFAENTSLEAVFALNDSLDVIYKFGWHEVVQDTLNDGDRTNRQGGGVCPFNNPEVLAGRLVAGESSQYCALDGGGNGTFTDFRVNYIFTSTQTSHEITLISDFDGPFNFTLGATYLEGDEPYVFKGSEFGSGNIAYRFNDTSAECEANIGAFYGPESGNNRLVRDVYTDPVAGANSAGTLYGRPGEPALTSYSDTGAATFVPGSGANTAFYSNVAYESKGVYANAEYVINDTWKMFGGLRDNDDTKGSQQCGYAGGFQIGGVHYLFALLRDGTLPPFPEKDGIEWGKVTWNIGTEFTPGDNYMVYSRVSTGYRPGGIACFRGAGFAQEEMINYEAGIKGVYFDNTLQLEASVYFQDFDAYWIHAQRLKTPEELQQEAQGAIPGSTAGSLYTGVVSVIDGTVISGIEIQGAWLFADRFTLRGFYNYMDSSIGAFESRDPFGDLSPNVPIEVLGPDGQTVLDADGNPRLFFARAPFTFEDRQLQNQPEHKYSLTVAYDTPVPAEWGSLELLTILNYRSDKFVDVANTERFKVPAYTKWDIRANWRSSDQKYAATFYVTNVLDEIAVQMWSPREGQTSPWGTLVEPREIGLSVQWQL